MSDAEDVQCRACNCTGACCHRYVVNLCGHDVWLISTQLRLRPEEFTVVVSQDNASLGGFRLEPNGKNYGLGLDKRRWGSRGKVTQRGPCIFLIRMKTGVERCGIHAIRPVACRVYPMSILNDELKQSPQALCPAGSWVLDARQELEWRRSLNSGRMQFDIYSEVLARWNERVDAAPAATHFSILEFYAYLLNAYDRIERLTARIDAGEMDEIVATWPKLPRTDLLMTNARASREVPSWLRHLDAIQDVLGDFYPDLSRQSTDGV